MHQRLKHALAAPASVLAMILAVSAASAQETPNPAAGAAPETETEPAIVVTGSRIRHCSGPRLIRVRAIRPDRRRDGSLHAPRPQHSGKARTCSYHLRAAYQHWNSLNTLARANLNEAERDWVLWKSAHKLLKLDERANPPRRGRS